MNNVTSRSSFVTALSWVFIALSGFASIIAVLQNIMIRVMFPEGEMGKAFAQSQREVEIPGILDFMVHNINLVFLGFLVISILTFAASIGLLKRKNWARLLFIGIMGLGIFWNLGGIGLNAMFYSDVGTAEFGELPSEFTTMKWVMLTFSVIFALAFTALFGWIIARLVSETIRSEFV